MEGRSQSQQSERVIVVIDCEFCCLPWTSEQPPLWIGLARHDSGGPQQWSAFNADAPTDGLSNFSRERVLPMVPADEPRLRTGELEAQLREFCEGVTEFWAWCPTIGNLIDVFGLTEQDAVVEHAVHWDHDLTLLKRLVQPWPTTWPTGLGDLNAKARQTGVELPVNPNPHHPGVDAMWGLHVLERMGEVQALY